MAAAGQKYRVTAVAPGLGHAGGNTTSGRDPLDRSKGGSKHDYIIAVPGSTAAVGHVAQRLGRPPASGDLLEFVLREESDIAAIGRPEGERGVLGARHRLRLKRIQRPQPELLLSIHRRRDGDVAAIGGNGEAVHRA